MFRRIKYKYGNEKEAQQLQRCCNSINNETLYSYCVDYNGSEKYQMKICTFNETSPKCLDIKFPLIPYADYVWSGDNLIYYTQSDSSNFFVIFHNSSSGLLRLRQHL